MTSTWGWNFLIIITMQRCPPCSRAETTIPSFFGMLNPRWRPPCQLCKSRASMLCAVRVESDWRWAKKSTKKLWYTSFLILAHFSVITLTKHVVKGTTQSFVHGGREIFYGSGEKRLQRANIRGPKKSISRDSGTSYLSNAAIRGKLC